MDQTDLFLPDDRPEFPGIPQNGERRLPAQLQRDMSAAIISDHRSQPPFRAGDKRRPTSLCDGLHHFNGATFHAARIKGRQNLKDDWPTS